MWAWGASLAIRRADPARPSVAALRFRRRRRLLRGIAGEGVAVVLISSEIAELITHAERVLVFRSGRISGELTRGDINEEAILMRAMAS